MDPSQEMGPNNLERTPLLEPPKRADGPVRRAVTIAAVVGATGVLFIGITFIFLSKGLYPPPERDPASLLSFVAVGDWGFGTARHQPESARFMGYLSSTLAPDFVIGTGDNMYPNGMKGQNDPKFVKRFSRMYASRGLQVPWYNVLGNHDYGDGSQIGDEYMQCKADSIEQCRSPSCCPSPVWQMTKHAQKMDSRWHCSNGTHKMTFLDGALDIIFIDTTPYISRHRNSVWASNPGGLLAQDAKGQRAEFERLLLESSAGPAKWRLVVGHHAVRSYGGHCQNSSSPSNDCNAMSWMLPLLEKNRVQVYLNGHDHDLQHIKFPNETTHFITSGAGGDFRLGEFSKAADTMHAQYLHDGLGFVSVEVLPDVLTVTFHAVRSGNKPAHVVQVWDSETTARRR